MKKILLAIVIASVTFVGCEKKKGCTDLMSIKYDADAEEDDGSCEYAGQGGSSTIVATLEHHGNPIVSTLAYRDTAYIKFNSKESPGLDPSVYDLIVVGDTGVAFVNIPNLKPGYYWVQCAGNDPASSPPRVTGGIKVTINTNGEVLNKDVAVTE